MGDENLLQRFWTALTDKDEGPVDVEGAGLDPAMYKRMLGTEPPPPRSRTPRTDIDLPAPPSGVDRQAMLNLLGIDKPATSHPPERMFQIWKTQQGIDPRDEEVYDFRAARMAGAQRDETGHWPSDFKKDTHPNLVVGGFNTKTGERVAGTPLAKSKQDLIAQGWEPAAAEKLWASLK